MPSSLFALVESAYCPGRFRVLLSQYAVRSSVHHNGDVAKKLPNSSERRRLSDRAWASLRAHQSTLLDGVLASVAAFLGFADLMFDVGQNGTMFSWPSAAVIVVTSASLMVRRSHGVLVFMLVLVGRLVVATDSSTEVALSFQAAITLFTVARQQSRQGALAAGLMASIVAATTIVIVSPSAVIEEAIAEVVIVLLVLAVAEVVRTNQARTSEQIASQTAERVHAERLQIARDLHDVVAHSLTNIAVQSGVAARLIDTNPDHAKKALEIINEAGRDSLEELRILLGLLRTREDEIEKHPTPARPEDLRRLISDSVDAGLQIELIEHGEFPPDISHAVALASYRIVQESLTNIARYAGSVPVEIELSHESDHVTVRVTNTPGRPDQAEMPSTGLGIIGMTERAEAVGGTIQARTLEDGRFQVDAQLPYEHATD